MKAKELAEILERELKLSPDMSIEIEDSYEGDILEIESIVVHDGIVTIKTSINKVVDRVFDEGFELGRDL